MEFEGLATGVSIGITALCAFAVLFVSSKSFLHKIHLHNLTVEARTLRNEYQRRLEAIRSGRYEAVQLLPGLAQTDEEPFMEVGEAPPAKAA